MHFCFMQEVAIMLKGSRQGHEDCTLPQQEAVLCQFLEKFGLFDPLGRISRSSKDVAEDEGNLETAPKNMVRILFVFFPSAKWQ